MRHEPWVCCLATASNIFLSDSNIPEQLVSIVLHVGREHGTTLRATFPVEERYEGRWRYRGYGRRYGGHGLEEGTKGFRERAGVREGQGEGACAGGGGKFNFSEIKGVSLRWKSFKLVIVLDNPSTRSIIRPLRLRVIIEKGSTRTGRCRRRWKQVPKSNTIAKTCQLWNHLLVTILLQLQMFFACCSAITKSPWGQDRTVKCGLRWVFVG